MRLTPLGDRAVLVRLGHAIDDATRRRVLAACARLERQPIPGVTEWVPAFATVAVQYDPTLASYAQMAARLETALVTLDEVPLPAAREVEIPVCYGGEYGPDLETVARLHALTPDDVVRRHTGAEYVVHMIGFAPGFPYLGGLPDELATPRRAEPRTVVPAASVGIGGSQTGVYPIASPGGWQLIGRTPLKLFVAERQPASLLAAGDRVRFRAITPDELRARERNA